MDRPSVLEIPAKRHGEAAQPALFLAEGVEVEQGLPGVLVSPVSGVHDRDVAVGGHEARRAFPGGADDEEVGELAHHAGRVGQTLALAMEEVVTSVALTTWPPRRSIAVSKESRVLVLGSKKRLARMAP